MCRSGLGPVFDEVGMSLLPESRPHPLGGQLDAIIEAVADGVTVQSQSGEIVYANRAALARLGAQSLEELLASPLERFMGQFRLFDEHGRELPLEELPGRRALAEGRPAERVVRFRNVGSADDQWAVVKAMPVFDEAGKPVYSVNVFRDVTRERQSQAETHFLAEAMSALAESLDTASTLDAIAHLVVPTLGDNCVIDLIDESGTGRRVAEASVDPDSERALEKLRAYPVSEAVRDVVRTRRSRFIPEITAEFLAKVAVDETYRRVVRQVAPISSLTVPIVARGRALGAITVGMAGSKRRYSPEKRALVEEFGRRVAFAIDNAALFESLSRSREAAERATERIAGLQKVVAALSEAVTPEEVSDVLMSEGLASVDMEGGSVALLTPDGSKLEMIRIAGYPPDVVQEWKSMPLDVWMPLAEAVRTNSIVSALPEDYHRYPRIRRLAQVSGYVLFNAVPLRVRGRVIGAMGVASPERRELSEEDRAYMLALAGHCAQALERSRLYDAERRARERAEEATRSREDLLAVVSHDLRNPLSSVILGSSMLSDVLVRGGDPEIARRHVETIQLAALSMDRLIRDLVELSRIDAGNLSIDARPVPLDELIGRAGQMLAPLAADKAQRLDIRFESREVVALCDPERVLQILGNLVGNAIKFTPFGGTITLSAQTARAEIVISVQDTGPGISGERIEHMFDRYWQEKDDARGLGLGLSIAKGLVEAQGGRIWAGSSIGRGTTLSFSLPALPTPQFERRAL